MNSSLADIVAAVDRLREETANNEIKLIKALTATESAMSHIDKKHPAYKSLKIVVDLLEELSK